MRFRIEAELKNEQLPIDYRPCIISLFKHCLSIYDNGKHFDNYYESGKEKPFTFAVGIPNSKFTREKILVISKKVYITFSTGDMATGILFFNALTMQKNKAYPLPYENVIILKNIRVEKEIEITTNKIDAIFRSPLCVRKHNKENNKDIYYSYEKEGFSQALNEVLKLQIAKSNNLPTSLVDDFSIIPINLKKTVIKHHSQFIEATVGTVSLCGNIGLLNYLYKNGIASRKSSGFGLIEIIK